MSKKVGFITLGCKVNIYESNALKNELSANGFIVEEAKEDDDVYIINTCSVTNMADAKSRKMIRKAIKMNPNAIICVMGCFSQTNPDAKEIDGVDIIVGNGNKKEVVSAIINKLNDKKTPKYINILDILEANEYEPLDVTTYDHTRAFVKIEDGCENFCTYCIIPYARGPVRCKKADDVIKELIRITKEGYKEVVLAGIHTGRYLDDNTNLSGLIKRILIEVPELERLRLSSIEINEVDDEFIELMKNNKILANHLHLPLQSGSDVVLSKMERKYDSKFFKEKIDKIRTARPDISITTDVIVGFPYESNEEYIKSKNFITEIGFSKLHVFPYSMRKGTKAVEMPQVKDNIKKERALDLIEYSKELENNYALKFLDKNLDVIVEQAFGDDQMIGHSSNFLQIILPLNEKLFGKRIDVKVVKIQDGKIYGVIL
ncbi:MAG: tRNA (N(6)-L-threonylcarbamoyladenosine(37)-C(2))-methylthiotransferase MtaB [Anaeroplasma sp.]|nr:tRNA (N(6)-L-threonylcarbamoyladenosine(37)-C(2))-methylthiotransferase MtaB [Anaeroplasma sp.]